MNLQIEALSEIIGSCNTKCDHPFDCSHCKAFRVYDAGYRKVSDILHEIDEEICSAIQKENMMLPRLVLLKLLIWFLIKF